tara:strand:- start:106 stop:261 length:156 start_codon:yes stop_codon:yes gene_type:complete
MKFVEAWNKWKDREPKNGDEYVEKHRDFNPNDKSIKIPSWMKVGIVWRGKR